MPPEPDDAAMAAANHPVTMVRNAMVATSRAYGLDTQYLALPNYVQVGTSSGGDRLHIADAELSSRQVDSGALGVQSELLVWRARRG